MKTKSQQCVKTLGVLTAGGDAPGLNAVIRGVVKTAILAHDLKVIGIRDGFEGLLAPDGFVSLDLSSVRGILPRGGTILGTRNVGQFHIFFEEDIPETARQELLDRGIAALRQNGIDALIAIGGDGSQSVARRFHDAGFPVIGVPKTIDNDLWATDYTFGFDTAVQTATDALDRLTTTAESHDRVMILEVMGRDAGWIALSAGLAGAADILLIPEIPFHVDRIAAHINRREGTGANYHLIVVAEGAYPAGGHVHMQAAGQGHKRLGGIATWLAEELQKRIPNEVRFTVLGHIQRGGTPTSFDRILASRFGAYAVRMAVEGRFGEMVCLRTPNLTSVPIADAIGRYKTVDLDSDLIQSARALGLSLGD